jgi:hypothetical protein
VKNFIYNMLGVAILLSGVAGAFAQDATPPLPPVEQVAPAASPAPPAKFYLEVDQADLALLAQAINELPKKTADPLLLKLNGQLQAQAKIVENKEAAPPVPPKKGNRK